MNTVQFCTHCEEYQLTVDDVRKIAHAFGYRLVKLPKKEKS